MNFGLEVFGFWDFQIPIPQIPLHLTHSLAEISFNYKLCRMFSVLVSVRGSLFFNWQCCGAGPNRYESVWFVIRRPPYLAIIPSWDQVCSLATSFSLPWFHCDHAGSSNMPKAVVLLAVVDNFFVFVYLWEGGGGDPLAPLAAPPPLRLATSHRNADPAPARLLPPTPNLWPTSP